MPSSTSAWYVVHTRPQKEVLVAGLLQDRLTSSVFLPEVRQKGRQGMVLRPLFPGYLFAQVELTQSPPSLVNGLPGVIRLLAGPDGPTPVEGATIEALEAECRRINAAGGLFATDLEAGERVRLADGPLAGLEAVFVEPLPPGDRAAVLLQFLNRQNQVIVNLADLERIRRLPPRQRSSRGQGRPLRRQKRETLKNA